MNKAKVICLIFAVNLLFFQPCLAQQVKTKSSFSTWSLGGGGGWFGVPKEVMDRFVYESPKLDGTMYGLKLGYEQGSGSFLSTSYIFSFFYQKMSGQGVWRYKKDSDAITNGEVDFTQYSASMSIHVNLFDFSPINPYIGVGLGIGKANALVKGQLVESIDVEEEQEYDMYVPVFCLPVGLRLKFKEAFNIKIEGGFQNGFYAGGFLSVYF